ncbi:succinate dehydrogenase, hydrophobic membrane anchor protein [Paenalcaligenes niemegkensis]|uniref:succinate dehydrogenase, hydrophobic membrane anchor protein n=1 Tax=Paenalcaligenes niemegkensis TaxID=2895469 RepID=UPI001EE83DC7|nr:succinate dehydrogenase, hydrophobic membrane anchor protein [Paenalcaligenes niemegkensis]MCQ9615674.1 succinate dehydrogenase, hydrophobic membrane anchor protein [Paenalcaligenes niemegkensis]
MANPERIGTKRLVVGAHYGTMDFIVQRVTAVIMIVYTLVFLGGVLFSSTLDYAAWRNLFAFQVGNFPLGQLLATLFFLSLAWHAWIGVRDIWMDYVRATGIRLFLQVLTLLWLVAAIVFFAQIIWSL